MKLPQIANNSDALWSALYQQYELPGFVLLGRVVNDCGRFGALALSRQTGILVRINAGCVQSLSSQIVLCWCGAKIINNHHCENGHMVLRSDAAQPAESRPMELGPP